MNTDYVNHKNQLNDLDVGYFCNTLNQMINASVLQYPIPSSAWTQLEENSKEFNERIAITTTAELSEQKLRECHLNLNLLLGLVSIHDHPSLKAQLSDSIAKVVEYCNNHNITHDSLGFRQPPKSMGLSLNDEESKFSVQQRFLGYDEDTSTDRQIARQMAKELRPNRPMDRQLSSNWDKLIDGLVDNKAEDNYSQNLNRLEIEAVLKLNQRQAEENLRTKRILAMSNARQEVELDALDKKTKLMLLASMYLQKQCKDKRSGEVYEQ